jgi:hypothetical protein
MKSIKWSWGKLKDRRPKPFGWWYHKVLAEIGWAFRDFGWSMYYKHLNIMCDRYKINIYGEEA